MKELTNEQMEERIRNVKEHISNFLSNEVQPDRMVKREEQMINKRNVLIVGSGFHTASFAQALHETGSGKNVEFITIYKVVADQLNVSEDDLLNAIDKFSGVNKPEMNDFESICLKASKVFNKFSAASAPFIDHDYRPWYERAANKGGKKRKQNYNNRQPWRK